MDQMHATHTTEYHFGESFAGAVRTVLAAELLLTGFLRLRTGKVTALKSRVYVKIALCYNVTAYVERSVSILC